MPLEAATIHEAVLKELRQQVRIFREGSHAIADIAWRQNIEIAPQTARAAPVIRHGHDGGEVDRGLTGLRPLLSAVRMPLEPRQQSGQSRASANGHNTQRRLESIALRDRNAAERA